MKKILLFLLLGLVFHIPLYAQKHKVSLPDLIRLYEMRDTSAVDDFLTPKGWAYLSSDIENGGDKVDMWVYQMPNMLIGMVFLNIMNPNDPAPNRNQCALHLSAVQDYTDFLAQTVDAKFVPLKETTDEKGVKHSYYKNDKYLLLSIIDKSSKTPYKFIISRLVRK